MQGLQGRLVLTGGASQLAGMREFVQTKVGTQTRLGRVPVGDIAEEAHTAFTTCRGILKYASQEVGPISPVLQPKSGSFFGRLKHWLGDV